MTEISETLYPRLPKTEVSAPIPLTHISNSSDLVNSPVILYDARAPYINVVLKEYPYLSLYKA